MTQFVCIYRLFYENRKKKKKKVSTLSALALLFKFYIQKNIQSFCKLKVSELKEELKKNKLPVYGTKVVLIQRLLNFKDDYLTLK